MIRTILFFFLLLGLVACDKLESKKTGNSEKQSDLRPKFQIPDLPDKIVFCDGPLIMNDHEAVERLHRELIINSYYHSSTIQILLRSKRYLPLIEEILKKNGVPDDMKYLCVAESALTNATSPSGAKGFWQFMPVTGSEFGLRIDEDVDERLNIEKSSQAACNYLKTAHDKFQDWGLAAASYNMGMGGIENALREQKVKHYSDLYLNSETSRYVMRIVALKLILESPDDFGFEVNDNDYYLPVRTTEIEVTESIPDLIDWSTSKGITYKLLRSLNPWLIGRKLDVKGNSYKIKLPA